jgi:hypothetical protein
MAETKTPQESGAVLSALKTVNLRYKFVRRPVGIIDLRTNQIYNQKDFQLLLAAQKIPRLGARWLEWAGRSDADELAFEPEQPTISLKTLPNGNKAIVYNLWRPSPIKPVRGSVTPWSDLLNHLFPREADRRWAEQWCANSIVRPRLKPFSAIVLWGVGGAGKNLLGDVLAPLHGEGAVMVNHDRLFGRFNAWITGKTLIIADEIDSGDRKEVNRLKSLITATHIYVEEKHQPTFRISNYASFIISSNDARPIYLQEGDRRFFVIHVETPFLPEKGEMTRRWAESPEGSAALLWHFQNEVDLADFMPNLPAPMTEDKQALIEDSQNEYETLVRDAIDAAVQGEKPQLTTLDQLAEEYDSDARGGIRNGIKFALMVPLRQLGAKRLKKIRLGPGITIRPWSLTNHKYWAAAGVPEIKTGLAVPMPVRTGARTLSLVRDADADAANRSKPDDVKS